jgi:DNA-binding response OmpR family regulator
MGGNAEDEAARLDLLQPGRPFIQKPFAPKDLARRVRAVLDQQAAARSRA